MGLGEVNDMQSKLPRDSYQLLAKTQDGVKYRPTLAGGQDQNNTVNIDVDDNVRLFETKATLLRDQGTNHCSINIFPEAQPSVQEEEHADPSCISDSKNSNNTSVTQNKKGGANKNGKQSHISVISYSKA